MANCVGKRKQGTDWLLIILRKRKWTILALDLEIFCPAWINSFMANTRNLSHRHASGAIPDMYISHLVRPIFQSQNSVSPAQRSAGAISGVANGKALCAILNGFITIELIICISGMSAPIRDSKSKSLLLHLRSL